MAAPATRGRTPPVPNEEMADALERIAELLDVQRADGHRVRAYRNAARQLRALEAPVSEVDAAGGRRGLETIPGVGRSIATLIHELLHTGRSGLLERLQGEVSPEDLFTTLPGIGEELAGRLHEDLGVDTLEELELAAHDGRLEGLPGFGPRRTAMLRDALAMRLGRSARWRARRIAAAGREGAAPQPDVAMLLAVDAEYRRRASEGSLRLVAPRRFNPEHRAWLPVLHAERGGFSFHALFSNTARAHRLGTTRDWVVLHWERDGDEAQCTVVTEHQGPLAGRRVVRGRETECAVVFRRPASPRSRRRRRRRDGVPRGSGSRPERAAAGSGVARARPTRPGSAARVGEVPGASG